MGCVQSLFGPSKSRSSSPERIELENPTFDTVVTRQPQKSKTGDGRTATGDDDKGVSKCDDFESFALDEDADQHSLHDVEATALGTLAAHTGSVALLGTTAKRKLPDGSPGEHEPREGEQETSSPSSSTRQATAGSKSPSQLESRFVDATAVRHLVAETGTIAVLSSTADLAPKKPDRATSGDGGKDDEETGSIHYVEATAVRKLAADTGSIAILSFTAANGQPPKSVQETDDVNRIPVGVAEVLDSEPGERQEEQEVNEEEQQDQKRDPRVHDDDDLHIPLPVIYAMEMKPDVRIPEKTSLSKPMSLSSSFEKQGLPPRSMTTDGSHPTVATELGSVAETASATRNPFVRQSNESKEQNEDEDVVMDFFNIPKIPVFAKCVPAKSKNQLPKNSMSVDVSMREERRGIGQHGVVRGTSLPYNTSDSSETGKQLSALSECIKEKDADETGASEPGISDQVELKVETSNTVKPNVNDPNETKTDIVKSEVVEPKANISDMDKPESIIVSNVTEEPNVIKSEKIESNIDEYGSVRQNAKELKEVDPKLSVSNDLGSNVLPDVIESNEGKPNKVVKSESAEPSATEFNSAQPDEKTTATMVIKSDAIKSDNVQSKVVEVSAVVRNTSEPNEVESKTDTSDEVKSELITATKVVEPKVVELIANVSDEVKSEVTTTPKVIEPKVVESKVNVSDEIKSKVFTAPIVVKPNMMESKSSVSDEIKSEVTSTPNVVKPKVVESKASVSDEIKSEVTIAPKVIELKVVESKANVSDEIKSEVITTPKVIEPKVVELIANVSDEVKTELTTTPKVAKPKVVEPKASVSDEIKSEEITAPKVIEPKVLESKANVSDEVKLEVITAPKVIDVESKVVASTAVKRNPNKPDEVEPQKAVASKVIGPNAIESNENRSKEAESSGIGSEKVKSDVESVPGRSVDDDDVVLGGDRTKDETAATPVPERPSPTTEKSLERASPENDAGRKPDDEKTASAGGDDDPEAEYRLTMIQSVREAVNRICEQAVEKTAAIVKSGRGRTTAKGTGSRTVRDRRDADDSEAADYASSEFSLAPPPPQPSDPASMGLESSWPPPPPLSEGEEERTIAPGFSFDLPDPPTEMDQMDSETDKLDISDEDMRATGLPSDDEDKTDKETGR